MGESGSERYRRRGRDVWWGGMLVSVAIHALVFLLWPSATVLLQSVQGSDAARALDPAHPLQMVDLSEPRLAPQTARPVIARQSPRVAVREIAPWRPTLALTPADPIPVPRGPSAPGDAGDPSGARLPAGEGYVQPIARSILPEWRAPRTLHGVVVTARVYVDASGDPTGLVELVPPTRFREVNREIVYRVRRLEYQPARENGRAVAAWAEVTFVFCRTGVTATSPAPRRIREAPCPQEG